MRWKRILLGVALVVAALLVEPQLYLVKMTSAPVVVLAALLAYWFRQNVWDGILFGAAHLVCAVGLEPVAGPQLLACISLLLLAITGRPRFALVVGCSLIGLLVVAMRLKDQFGGSGLTWQDLRYFFREFSDNVGVMATQPTLLLYGGAAILLIAGAAVAMWKLDRPPVVAVRPIGERVLARAAPFLLAFWCAQGIADSATRLNGMGAWHFGQSRATPVSTFFSTMYLDPRAQFQRVDTRQFAVGVKALEGAASAAHPADIVVFLQESQFNPRLIKGCPESLCSLEGFRASPETSDYGQLRSHVYGGGTWLSEFALATGLPHELFGPAGSFASFNVAPGIKQSFIRSLKAAGYYTVAVYPVRGGMMNARAAYHAYGFDEFQDAVDLGLPGHFGTSDKVMHTAALKALDSARRHGKPVFVLAVTIFNHGEHGLKMDRVDPGTFPAAQAFSTDPAEWRNLADYVWRTREFERSYALARREVLGSARPAVLAWFGDHQPPFASAPALRNAIKASPAQAPVPDRFITWYDIATNLGTPLTRSPPTTTDIVFLPGLLAQRAGVPLDQWLGANVLARQKCGGLLMECPDSVWRDAYLTYLLDDLKAVQ